MVKLQKISRFTRNLSVLKYIATVSERFPRDCIRHARLIFEDVVTHKFY